MKPIAWLHARRHIILPVLALIILTAAVSAPVYYQRLREPTTDDYDAHVVFTLRLLNRDLPPTFVLAHPLLQLIIGFLYWAGRGRVDIFEAAAFVQVAAQVAAALAIYFWLGNIPGKPGTLWRVLVSLTLTLVAPIMLFAPLDGKFYFGYIGLASYHNPTVHLLRPFAVLSFIFVIRTVTHTRTPVVWMAVSAALMFGGALAKPSYTTSILPVLGLIGLWGLWRGKQTAGSHDSIWKAAWSAIDWRLLILGLALPALLSIVLQTVVVYLVPDADPVGIMLAPFVVERAFSDYLPWKFLLSIAFPLVAALFFWRKYREDVSLPLAWLAFFSGVLQLYLLAETGDRLMHGNFRWSAQITLFLLFVATARFLLNRAGDLPLWQRSAAWAVYLLHLAGGVAYYIASYIRPGYD